MNRLKMFDDSNFILFPVNIQKVEHYTFYQLSDYGVDVCKDIFNSKSKHYMSYPLAKNYGD